MKCKKHLLLFAACTFPVLASADDWVTSQGISYWCAGVGAESQAQIKNAESAANARLMVTAGPERSYLSDVKLTVTSADKQRSASWQASGPICLLKLPQGSYTVEASYRDERRSAPLSITPGKSGSSEPLIFNFKPS